MIKRIIQRMAQLRDIYVYVNIINKLAKKLEGDLNAGIIIPDSTFVLGEPSVTSVRGAFRKRRFIPDRSSRSVQKISGLAEQEKYIKKVSKYENGIHYNAYQIKNDGWNLIQRSFFGIFPKGLMLAWASKNKEFATLLISFVGGIIFSAVTALIAILSYNKTI